MDIINNISIYVTSLLSFLKIYLFPNNPCKKRTDKEKLLGIKDIPGPKSPDPTGILGHLLYFRQFEKIGKILHGWSEEFGDIFKFSAHNQTYVVLNSGPLIKTLLQSSDLGHLTKTDFPYNISKPFTGNGIGLSNGNFWKHQRKIIIKVQSYEKLNAYIPLINKQALILTGHLANKFNDGEYKQISDLIFASYLKTICEIITGRDIYDNDEFVKFHYNLKTWMEVLMTMCVKPWLIFKPICWIHPLLRRHNKAVRELLTFSEKMLSDHKSLRKLGTTQAFKSVLDDLLDAQVDDKQIIYELNNLMMAGQDTVATTTKFLLLSLACYPDIQTKCQEEIDKIFEDGREFITFHDAQNRLHFLEKCIMETLRLFPPLPAALRKLEKSLTINWKGQECHLPPGTNILVCPWILHSKPDIFPNPQKFDPSRFLKEKIAKRHSHTFIPFLAGPRNCPGMKVAIIEIKIVVAHILRNFIVTTKHKMEELVLLPNVILTPTNDFYFILRKRTFLNNN